MVGSSNHKVDIFPLGPLRAHPNADSLSLIKIGETDYSYVGRTDDWKDKVGSLVAWIPPDSIVNLERDEFKFLKEIKGSKHPERIRAKKLRGIYSYGLLVSAPPALRQGDDGAASLEVTHYQPRIATQSAQFEGTSIIPGPDKPNYDVESYLKYGRKVLRVGEHVVVTEKLHGACARYVFISESESVRLGIPSVMYHGSRSSWKSEYALPNPMTLDEILSKVPDPVKAQAIFDKIKRPGTRRNLWWDALTVEVRDYCVTHPGYTVYGEVFGNVQDMKYGATTETWLRVFDVLTPEGWMSWPDLMKTGLALVPLIGVMSFDFDVLLALASGNSLIPGAESQIREGVVVKPLVERWDEAVGRVSFKIINPKYLES